MTFSGAASASKQPNILFLFTDDHATQALSAYNHPLKLVQTPNLDRIAEQGLLFERCLVPNSICGPVRATILTGKYSHLNGFYRNSRRFDGSQQTFPKLLQGAGYQTALIGKWHLGSNPTGFDHWHILPDQGIYYNPPMIKDGKRVQHEGYVTDLVTDFSLEWLKHRDKSKPFLLMSQHKAPHREWAPNLKHLGWNKDRKFPEPETLFDDYSGRGRAEREQDMSLAKTFTARDAKLVAPPSLTPEQRKIWDAYYEPRNEEFRNANLTGKELVRWRYQRYMHDYLATIISVDENVGRLLQFLEDEGLRENTIVIYASDQGFYLGEHGWFDKRWIYEESLTTPFLVRWPGITRPGSRSKAMVSVLDFAPTLLEAAGVSIPSDMQGRSLLPLFKGQTPADWRTSFYYHYYEFPGPHSVRKHYGVVTDRYKLFHFYEPEMNYWTLIDRQKDPHELTNVYGNDDYAKTRKELHAELERLRKELKVPAQDPPESFAPKRSSEQGRLHSPGIPVSSVNHNSSTAFSRWIEHPSRFK
jgi:arylsulfatase A-like enzyme